MNRKRREKINTAMGYLDRAYQIVDTVCDEESDAYDNMPENLQESDRGYKMEAAVDALEDAKSYLDDAKDAIREAQASLRDAAQ